MFGMKKNNKSFCNRFLHYSFFIYLIFFFFFFVFGNFYGVYISQLISFARVCSHVDDFNTRNKCLNAKLLKQGYRYHKLRKAFFKFYRQHYELISKLNVG